MKLKKIISGLFLILPFIVLFSCNDDSTTVTSDVPITPDVDIVTPDDDDNTENNDNEDDVNPPVLDDNPTDDNPPSEEPTAPDDETNLIDYSDFEYKITSSNALYLQKEETYYVYFYNENSDRCNNIKEEILTNFKDIINNNIAKIYLIDSTAPNIQNLIVTSKQEEYIINSTRLNPMKIFSIPTIIKIENETAVSYSNDASNILTYVSEITNVQNDPVTENVTSTINNISKTTSIFSTTKNQFLLDNGGFFWNDVSMNYNSDYKIIANDIIIDLSFIGPVNFTSEGEMTINNDTKYYELVENFSGETEMSAILKLNINGKETSLTNTKVSSKIIYSYEINGSTYITTNEEEFENVETIDNAFYYANRTINMKLSNKIIYTIESDELKLSVIVEENYDTEGESKITYEFECKTNSYTTVKSNGEKSYKTYGNEFNKFTYDIENKIIEENIYFYDSIN